MLRVASRFLMILALALVVLLHGGYAQRSMAQDVDSVKPPPTEPVYEVDPGKRPGYLRVHGYWKWTGENYMWMPGRWIKNQPDHIWVADSWTERGDKWHFTPGHWEADGNAPVAPETAEPADTIEHHEEANDAEEADTSASDAKSGNKKSVKPHRPKPAPMPDYGNTTDWPRVIHH